MEFKIAGLDIIEIGLIIMMVLIIIFFILTFIK